jgi:DNA-binding NtrC family response regulator
MESITRDSVLRDRENAMNILLTFAGVRDPFNAEMVQDSCTDGPVLSLLKERSFETIYIFTTPNTLDNARSLQTEIGTHWPDISTHIVFIDIPDPTDYEALYLHMFRHSQTILETHKKKKEAPRYFIATASGTPQMQTVWFLLCQSGIIPSTLLKITPPRFLRPGKKAVSEIHLTPDSFPRMQWPSESELNMAAMIQRMEKLEVERAEMVLEFGPQRMIGKSPTLLSIRDTIRAASQYDSAILIHGETGTGKEIVARAIHYNSLRKKEPFIVVNCAAIPESLVESELFGHEKGAFTGAIQQQKGKFELADGGSIFLDEIGDMPLPAQAKILRAVQDGEVTRIASVKPIKTNVRIMAATHRDLARMIGENRFREDLYYRLKIIDIHLPALRERREDIPLLVEHFLERNNQRWRQKKQISREVMRCLLDHAWPGNIRELENAIERAFVLCTGNVIRKDDLPPEVQRTIEDSVHHAATIAIPTGGIDLDQYLSDMEKAYFKEAIRFKEGNKEAAANLLKIKPHTFRKRAKEKFDL